MKKNIAILLAGVMSIFVIPRFNVNAATNIENNLNTSTNKSSVEISSGSKIMKVNGNDQTLEVAPYVSKASNSIMVPLRYISYALGLSEDSVKWDPKTSTVTVNANGRIVEMKTNDNIMKINGNDVPMLSKDGLKTNIEVKENRVFVPFRALGEALDVKVDWNADTATATYISTNNKISDDDTNPDIKDPIIEIKHYGDDDFQSWRDSISQKNKAGYDFDIDRYNDEKQDSYRVLEDDYKNGMRDQHQYTQDKYGENTGVESNRYNEYKDRQEIHRQDIYNEFKDKENIYKNN